MTPVQASAIPLFMGHKDVVVEVSVNLRSCPIENILVANFLCGAIGSNWQRQNTCISYSRNRTTFAA